MGPRLRLGPMQRHGASATRADRRGERRQAWRRMRWRMRGAWQWPAFFACTLLGGVVLDRLPFYGDGPGSFVGGALLAGFINLLLVAVVAPLSGRLLRRRRPDLPRLVASNYAGTALVSAALVVLVAGGIAHRPAADAAGQDRLRVLAAVHRFVLTEQPALGSRLGSTDVLRLEPTLYRACVPRSQANRWLCLFVSTEQSPAGVTLDHDEEANGALRAHGGF
jgi:hypothetical protein